MSIEKKTPTIGNLGYRFAYIMVFFAGIFVISQTFTYTFKEAWFLPFMGLFMIGFSVMNIINSIRTNKEPIWNIHNPIVGAIVLLVLLGIALIVYGILTTILLGVSYAVVYYAAFFKKK